MINLICFKKFCIIYLPVVISTPVSSMSPCDNYIGGAITRDICCKNHWPKQECQAKKKKKEREKTYLGRKQRDDDKT